MSVPHIILQNPGGLRYLFFSDEYNPGNQFGEVAHDTIRRRLEGLVCDLVFRSSYWQPSKRGENLSMGGACEEYLCG